MCKLVTSLAVAAMAFVSSANAQVEGGPPEFDAVKWYNTPPLALKQLLGKAVMIEVFRTW